MRAFLAVCDTGGFSAAGRHLGLSSPATTRLVSALEDVLGVQLFHRNTRSVRLTQAGAVYRPLARETLDRAALAEQAARAEGAAPSGTIRIAMPLVFGRLHAAPVIADFINRHPETRIELFLGNEHARLIEDRVDLAIRIGVLPDSELTVRKLGSTGVVLAASPGYCNKAGTPRSPDELASHRLIGSTGVVPRRVWSFRIEDRNVRINVDPIIHSNNAEAAIAHAEAGLGIVSALHYQISPQLRSGALVEVLAAFRPDAAPIQLVLPRARYMSPAVRALADAFGAARSRWSDGPGADGAARSDDC